MAERRSPEEIQKAQDVAQKVMQERRQKDGEKSIRRAQGTLIFLGCLIFGIALWESYGL